MSEDEVDIAFVRQHRGEVWYARSIRNWVVSVPKKGSDKWLRERLLSGLIEFFHWESSWLRLAKEAARSSETFEITKGVTKHIAVHLPPDLIKKVSDE